jgi:hypothetical protein
MHNEKATEEDENGGRIVGHENSHRLDNQQHQLLTIVLATEGV